ncbi:MAG: hypothetical protein AAGI71_09260 [Bacteroidota bacterium]
MTAPSTVGPLQITFVKRRDGQARLICTRPDGTTTETPLRPGFGVAHDLAHYVAETGLGLTEGFYGLVAQGHAIQSFERPRSERPPVGTQALQAEAVAMALQHIAAGTGTAHQLRPFVEASCEGSGVPAPTGLTEALAEALWARYHVLMAEWKALPPRSHLVLPFPG